VVEVAVRDYGIGMSEEIRANLFNINNLISHEGTEQERGTGLGLLLCKEFIEKHNGEIWAVSEINGGSCFHFTLLQYKV